MSLRRTAQLARPLQRRVLGPVRLFASTSRVRDNAEQSALEPEPAPEPVDVHLFVASVFPIRLGTWDIRQYLGLLRQDALLARLREIVGSAPGTTLVALEPHNKDGGVFVHVRSAVATGPKDAHAALVKHVEAQGGIPRWTGLGRADVWLVQGKPWREDMARYSSPILRVAFDGPDVPEEELYALLRPFGRISQIDLPSSSPPPPTGVPRAAVVSFRHLSSATAARNALHGLNHGGTRLRTAYQPAVQAHAARDWIAKHPRIVGPVALFLLGSLTYTVWDPIRTLMVEGRMLDWFDYRQYGSYQWLQHNVFVYLPWAAPPVPAAAPADDSEEDSEEGNGASPEEHAHLRRRRRRASASTSAAEEVWQERHAAEDALSKYLLDTPTTPAYLHGPAGSGKRRMLDAALNSQGRRTLIIDVRALTKAGSDAAVINALAGQTGYWPVFAFLNQFNTWIDLASVGLIGQKAGLATGVPDQVRQVLAVVGSALGGVKARETRAREKAVLREERVEREQARAEEPRVEASEKTVLLSPVAKEPLVVIEETAEDEGWLARLPALPSSVSDLAGLPGRLIRSASSELSTAPAPDAPAAEDAPADPERARRASAEAQAVRALPVVVLDNFGAHSGAHKDAGEVLDALAAWAASLVEGGLAHVVVVAEKRDDSKRLAAALPTKPLTTIMLADADPATALSFVQGRLSALPGAPLALGPADAARIAQLGGRAADLERLVRKVGAGAGVADAVEDLVRSDGGALRKAAFEDDARGWRSEQAWVLVRRLARADEVPYYDVLSEVFKGDEGALRAMEHAELIAITTDSTGRPAAIRPGKPVYRTVFERLVADGVFAATQDLALNAAAAATAEKAIRGAEEELLALTTIGASRAVRRREDFLLEKMRVAQVKLEALEREAAELKKVLAKGG